LFPFFMKKILSHIVCSFCVIAVHSQTPEIDSLKLLLEKEERDTSRVLLLEELSVTYLTSEPDTALLLAQEGLSLSREIGFEAGEAISLNRIGAVLSSTGNDALALENLLQALEINERIKNDDGIIKNLGNISNIHANQGDYRKALNYTFKEKSIAEKLLDKRSLAISLLAIGDIYENIDKLDSARIYTQQAYELALDLKDDNNTGIALNNLGNIYVKMGQDRLAMEFYRASLKKYERGRDDEGICEVALGMAELFKNSTYPDSALIYARRSLTLARKKGFAIYTFEASQFLTAYFKAKNKIDSAFIYQQISIEANDSLFDKEKSRHIQQLTFNENIRQQKIEDEKIKTEKDRKNNLQFVGIATVIIAVSLLLLVFYRRKTNARVVKTASMIVLLLSFEFISLLIDPLIAKFTHHTPVYMLLALAIIAAFLIPLHHRMEKWIKEELAQKDATPVQHPETATPPKPLKKNG
jgi:tetratricopeptide (TPR) repeat protein